MKIKSFFYGNKSNLISLILILTFGLIGIDCAKKKSSSDKSVLAAVALVGGNSIGKNTGTNGQKSNLRLNFTAASAGAQSSLNGSVKSNLLNNKNEYIRATTPTYSNTDFVTDSIASGTPDSLTLTIKKISLSSSNSDVPIFQDTTGKDLKITGSRMDISDLFTKFDCIDNNGNGVTLTSGQSCDCGFDSNNNPVGMKTWTRKNSDGTNTTVDGCPWEDPDNTLTRGSGGKFATLNAQNGAYTQMKFTFSRKAKVKGCVTGNFGNMSLVPVGIHTYCTQSSKSMIKDSGGGINSDFENKTAEEMDFDIVMPAATWITSDDTTIGFPIKGGVTLSDSQATPLTLVIDTNRILRFFNMGRSDQGPIPNAPVNKSFFFTTVFDSSIFGFAGQAGSILGYQWVTKACTNVDTANIPTSYECSNGGVVAGWLTVITDPTGLPMGFSFMPDDDNALTVIKGGNSGPSGFIDGSIASTPSSGIYDLTYYIGFGNNQSSGVFYGFNVNQTLGQKIDGIKFRGLQNSYGLVTLTRKL